MSEAQEWTSERVADAVKHLLKTAREVGMTRDHDIAHFLAGGIGLMLSQTRELAEANQQSESTKTRRKLW